MNVEHENPIPPIQVRADALTQAIKETGLLSDAFIQDVHDALDQWQPENGARVVARAWTDPAFRARLLEDATSACAELGYGGPQGEYMVALENTPELQNVIVCTQCSCTAWPVLGLPAGWYKSFEYRSRVVRESRQVLKELGLDLPLDVKIQVWDTSAETRYMVLPFRPDGTEDWTEEQLAKIVTKDVLVGVSRPKVEI
ncbi:MAG TPA: nitrile hydratase subunit alpha [Sphingobium sp.]